MADIEIQYRIANIKEKRFFIQKLPSLAAATIKADTTYSVEFNYRFEEDTKFMNLEFDIKLFPRINKEVTLLHYVVSMNFEIAGFNIFADEDGKASLPINVTHTLIAIAYSTLRGAIYTRCGGSILRDVTRGRPRLFHW